MVDAISTAAEKVGGASWRTTAAGLVSALLLAGPELAKLLDGDPATNPAWPTVLGFLAAGLGLGLARDNRVTSEAAGLHGPTT